jgi:hypothetical protein
MHLGEAKHFSPIVRSEQRDNNILHMHSSSFMIISTISQRDLLESDFEEQCARDFDNRNESSFTGVLCFVKNFVWSIWDFRDLTRFFSGREHDFLPFGCS